MSSEHEDRFLGTAVRHHRGEDAQNALEESDIVGAHHHHRNASNNELADKNSDDDKKSRKRSRSDEVEEPLEEPQNYPKKKKEYKATSTFIADDEFEDILEHGWFYVDYNGDKQGPFTTKEMKEWFVAGFFNNEILVKRISDTVFQRISDREEFKHLERKPHSQTYAPNATFDQLQNFEQESAQNPYYQDFLYDPSYDNNNNNNSNSNNNNNNNNHPSKPPAAVPPPVVDTSSYSQAAYFTKLNGRFSVDQMTHWRTKGLPMDKDGRMMSHYFDVDAYQEQMRNAPPPKKKKVTKSMIKYFQKRKEDKKRRRVLMLLHD